MATTLYLLNATWDTNRYKLDETNEASTQTKGTNTATGSLGGGAPTYAGETQLTASAGGSVIEWCSASVTEDVTISGAVTFNIYMQESMTAANAGGRAYLYKVSSDRATWTLMGGGPFDDGVEFGTSISLYTWTGTPTTNNALSGASGDRLGVRFFLDPTYNDGTNYMASGYTATLSHASATYPSSIATTETLSFGLKVGEKVELAGGTSAISSGPFLSPLQVPSAVETTGVTQTLSSGPFLDPLEVFGSIAEPRPVEKSAPSDVISSGPFLSPLDPGLRSEATGEAEDNLEAVVLHLATDRAETTAPSDVISSGPFLSPLQVPSPVELAGGATGGAVAIYDETGAGGADYLVDRQLNEVLSNLDPGLKTETTAATLNLTGPFLSPLEASGAVETTGVTLSLTGPFLSPLSPAAPVETTGVTLDLTGPLLSPLQVPAPVELAGGSTNVTGPLLSPLQVPAPVELAGGTDVVPTPPVLSSDLAWGGGESAGGTDVVTGPNLSPLQVPSGVELAGGSTGGAVGVWDEWAAGATDYCDPTWVVLTVEVSNLPVGLKVETTTSSDVVTGPLLSPLQVPAPVESAGGTDVLPSTPALGGSPTVDRGETAGGSTGGAVALYDDRGVGVTDVVPNSPVLGTTGSLPVSRWESTAVSDAVWFGIVEAHETTSVSTDWILEYAEILPAGVQDYLEAGWVVLLGPDELTVGTRVETAGGTDARVGQALHHTLSATEAAGGSDVVVGFGWDYPIGLRIERTAPSDVLPSPPVLSAPDDLRAMPAGESTRPYDWLTRAPLLSPLQVSASEQAGATTDLMGPFIGELAVRAWESTAPTDVVSDIYELAPAFEPERTWRVPRDDREWMVPADDRGWRVDDSDRGWFVPAED